MVGPPDRVQAIHKLRLVTRQHGTRMHTDGASNLLMLSVRSCCSSSTTHRRTLPDHVGYFSVTFSDGGEMEARWRRDGGETEARRRRDGGELEASWRRDADGGETADVDEVEARWQTRQMEARDGGEMEARRQRRRRRGWRRRGWRGRRCAGEAAVRRRTLRVDRRGRELGGGSRP